MSNDEKDKAIGKMVQRYGEAKKSRAAARGEANRLSENFRIVSDALLRFPERIRIEQDALYIIRGLGGETAQIPLADLQIETLKSIAETASSAQETIESLEPQLQELGVFQKPGS